MSTECTHTHPQPSALKWSRRKELMFCVAAKKSRCHSCAPDAASLVAFYFDSGLHDSNVSGEMPVSAGMMGFFLLNIDAVWSAVLLLFYLSLDYLNLTVEVFSLLLDFVVMVNVSTCIQELVEVWRHLLVSLCLCCFSPSESSSVSDEHSDERAHLRRDHPGCHERLLLHLLPHSAQRQERSCQQPVCSTQPSLQLSTWTQLTADTPQQTMLSEGKTTDVMRCLCM